MSEQPVDIALVRMPYSEIGQPSLALGLLKAGCDKIGLRTRNVAANLWYAEDVGPAIHDLIFEAYSTTLVGEWTFSGALFPDYHPDDEAYLRKVVAILCVCSNDDWRYLHDRFPYLDYVTLLRELRRRAPQFVEKVADRVLALEPRIVGCTSTFQQHCASLSLLREIKRRRPDIITMIGGANCEGDMGRVTFEQFPFLDFVVSGEADAFFAPMCRRILESGVDSVVPLLPAGVWGPHHRRDPASVGAACRSQVDGAPIARLDDMNESPIPNYDDYFAALAEAEWLGKHLRPALPFQTARGCWWGEKTHCTFCGISRTAMKFRAKSGDNVMDQMVTLRDRYGINSFQGTEYIFDYRFFDSLLPRLKELGSYFRFEVKANLKVEQLQSFIDSGTIEVQPGVESLNDECLGLLKKGTTAFKNVLLLRRARQIGLLVYWNLLHTIPGDRDEWYWEMGEIVPLLTHLQPPAGFAQIHYDRFSPYWRNPEQHGLTLKPAFGYEMVYPFPPEVLKDTAYFFETPRQKAGFLKYELERHPGLYHLIAEVQKWKTGFHARRSRHTLVCTDHGDRITFEDTRAVAVEPRFQIEGLEAEVYRATEDGITPLNLARRFLEDGTRRWAEGEIEDAVRRLVARKIVVSLSGRLVGLALADPVPPYLADSIGKERAELNPIWGKMNAAVLLDAKRPSIALSCLRRPQDEGLSGWLASVGRRSNPSRGEPNPAGAA